jgi:hypothetical protein
MNKIEALADAIVAYSGSTDPLSGGYKARNPGCLKSFTVKHPKDDKGLRIFKSWLDGYQALLFDLKVKCGGKSRSKVGPDSNLADLIRSYCLPDGTTRYVAKFLRKALTDDTMDEHTKLGVFND